MKISSKLLSAMLAAGLLCAASPMAAQAADNDLKWWQKTCVYQIYPKSFADTTGSGVGDLRGIIEHLDHIKSIGCGAIWLTPVYPSPMVDNGYDIANYTDIDPSYGTMADFENLAAEAKKRDIRLVMDLVFNHSSDKHEWFKESQKSRTNPKADWYIWRDAKENGEPPTNWRSIFGGSAWSYSKERGQYYLHTFAKEQPDLNWENPEVRHALYEAARFWLDKGVGGFRIDAITYIKKPAKFVDGKPDGEDGLSGIHGLTANTPGILDFLHEFKQEVFANGDIFTVGEANGVSPSDLPKWVGKDGVFDMVFEFSHMNLPLKKGEVWCRPTEWKLSELKAALTSSQKATQDNGWCPVFFENHDQPRAVNHFFPAGADTKKAAKAIAAVLYTMRGTPFVYEGQELGMTNVAFPSIDDYNDISSHGQYKNALTEGFSPQKALDFVHFFSRDNARTPMQWTNGANAGFTTGKPWLPVNPNYPNVNAALESADKNSVLSFYRDLGKLRRQRKELVFGSYEELLPADEQIFAFARRYQNKALVTAVNFSLQPAPLPKSIYGGKLIFASQKNSDQDTLLPLEARVYEETGR